MSYGDKIMKKIMICEKPSLARFAMSCLRDKEPFQQKKYKDTAYYESEHYLITNASGHIFEAYDICEYTKDDGEWRMDILPFCPPNNQFFFKLRQKKKDKIGGKETDPYYKGLYETIYVLLNRPDVTGIIHFGDAGREGEVIVRQIVRNANKSNKPMVRLWLNAIEKSAFMQAFSNMKDDSEYDNYDREGMTRAKVDNLYGVNLTIYISLKSGAPKGLPFHAGRVICAMTKEIYDREMEIENFVPEKYYAICSNESTKDTVISLRLKERFSFDDYETAAAVCGRLNAAGAVVTDITKERKKVGAGRLFSLTTLQGRLSTKKKMCQEESMKYVQSLYEKGFITYGRTNSEYLPEGEKDLAANTIAVLNSLGYDLVFKDSKTIFNSAKVEDHGALCPTKKIPKDGDLSDGEKIVYETIRNRFLAVFCKEDCIVDKSVMTIVCADQTFNITGTVLVQKGYLKYEENDKKDVMLPPLEEGDTVNVNFCPMEEQTKPPAHYTEESFGKFLENPFANEKQTDEERYESMMKGVEIGTVATRTSIITKMLDDHYIERKNGTYFLMLRGKYLIEIMQMLGIDMTKDKTVEVSVLLRKVFNNELTENEVIEMVKGDLNNMFQKRDIDIRSCTDAGVVSEKGFAGDPLGECPVCGGNVYETKNGYRCENASFEEGSACKFYLKKDGANAYFSKVTGSNFKPTALSSLLKYGYIPVKTKTKNKVEYETLIRFKIREDETIGFEINPVIGKCPVCGENVKATPFGYKCENENCYYIIFRKDKFITSYQHKEISIKQAMTILSKGCIVMTLEKKDKSGKYKMKFTQSIDRIEKKMTWNSEYVHQKKGRSV